MAFKLSNHIIGKAYDLTQENMNAMIYEIERLAKVEKEAKRILWIGDCRCDEAYTERKLHAPNTFCGELDDLRDAINLTYDSWS